MDEQINSDVNVPVAAPVEEVVVAEAVIEVPVEAVAPESVEPVV